MLKLRERLTTMAINYRKLWHPPIDRNMKKKDIQAQAGLTKYALNKLNRNENVTTETLGKLVLF